MKKILVLYLLCALFTGTLTAQNREDSLHIAHYDLHIDMTDFVTQQLSAHADLYAVSKVPQLSYINLDLKSLTVDSVIIGGTRTEHFAHTGELLHIELDAPMALGDTSFLRIYYHGHPTTDSYFGGFYYTGEYAFNIGVAFIDTPHNFGRIWYPCMDVFTDKSTYSFHIETQANKVAICGGLLTDTLLTADSTLIWTWELNQPTPSYLTSIAVGPYTRYHDTVQGMERILPIDIFTYPDHASKVEGSFVHLKDIFHLYENLFGPYPWDRIGYVEVDFDYGAMEHVCNIAYPRFAINGNTNYESLYAHELSHAWFGNLLTCRRAEEMWLNEGFARYSESLIMEGPYGNAPANHEAYQNSIYALHMNTINKAHTDDGGFWALNQVPTSVTYGSTSYDKGGLVVHALRQYMGDSLFFGAIRSMLAAYPYQNITSQQLFDHFANYSGLELQDFYESHVNQPGYLLFTIDSIRRAGGNHYRFYVRQRGYHTMHLGNNQKIDITFFAADRAQYTVEAFAISGEYAEGEVELPFTPLFAVVDAHEKLADAIGDCTMLLSNSGNYGSNSYAKFILNLSNITDTTFFRVENTFAPADPLKTPNEDIHDLSHTHYWRVVYTNEANLEGKMRFYFKATDELSDDYELLNGHVRNDLILLYRRDASDDWRIIPSSIVGNIQQGCLVSESIMSGEFAIGVGNRAAGLPGTSQLSNINIYPNPTHELVHIHFAPMPDSATYIIQLMNANGQLIETRHTRHTQEVLNMSHLANGIYFVRISQNSRIILNQKIIKE